MTATSRQTVTTVLNELEGKNILTYNRRRMLVRDLEKLAEDHQLWKSEIEQAHQTYMKELFVAAWRDGKITAGERKDLEAVRKLLSLPMHEYSELMEKAKKEAESSPDPASFMVSLEKIRGMSICFSGSPQCKIRGTVPSEMFAQSLAMEAGLKTQTSLSGELDFLVVPDREDSNIDLEQAQELGVRILAEWLSADTVI